MKAAQERQRREECERATSAAFQKARDGLSQNSDVLAASAVAALSAFGLVVLIRKPDVAQAEDETRA